MTEKQEQTTAGQPKDASAEVATPAREAPASVEEQEGHSALEGVEKEFINVGFVMGIVLGTVVIVAGLVLFGFTMTEVTSRDIRTRVLSETAYPDIREARAAAAGRLNQYAVVDTAAGIYRIPIDRAIDLLVNEQYQNQQAEDYSNEVMLLPSH